MTISQALDIVTGRNTDYTPLQYGWAVAVIEVFFANLKPME